MSEIGEDREIAAPSRPAKQPPAASSSEVGSLACGVVVFRSQAETIADATNLHRKPWPPFGARMPHLLRSVAMALLDVRPALMQRSMLNVWAQR
jgi:hypothetical protein